jgi:hypothetical protein
MVLDVIPEAWGEDVVLISLAEFAGNVGIFLSLA